MVVEDEHDDVIDVVVDEEGNGWSSKALSREVGFGVSLTDGFEFRFFPFFER